MHGQKGAMPAQVVGMPGIPGIPGQGGVIPGQGSGMPGQGSGMPGHVGGLGGNMLRGGRHNLAPGKSYGKHQQEDLPGWLSARITTKTDHCKYSCSKGGVCKVMYRGYTLGMCEPNGPCVGTPGECRDCMDVIQCRDKKKPFHGYTPGDKIQHANFEYVKEDLKILMKKSEDFWPADFGNYGPLFIRLAWHSAGSYRTSDGQGGSNGGRIRFDPESSWPDNSNLDKALHLLWPIKKKYGRTLSWGDLIILAGNAAIESMGGPILGFCGGRVDARNGDDSIILGPSTQQETLLPCEVNGKCKSPLGSTTVGLIYVNPEGPMGVPDPKASAAEIREVFTRMGMNDTETVALIGGGHTIGKCHGMCADGPGSLHCKSGRKGKGKETFTSGFELTWTSKPTSWDTEYFHNVHNLDWQLHKGPGDLHQWEPRVTSGTPPRAPTAFGNATETIGLLTSDYALKVDTSYRAMLKLFKDDLDTFNHAFKHAWYKLTTGDMGPRTRCINDDAPPAQPFQHPLPDPPVHQPNYEEVKRRIVEKIERDSEAIGKFTRLAWQCMSSFRATDYLGGCNGARLRFPPQKNWPGYENLEQTLLYLAPIINEFENLSWSDLIILAGNTAIEMAGGGKLKFCGGRTDATDGQGSKYLYPKIIGDFSESVEGLKYYISVMGLSNREFAALIGIGYAIGDTQNCNGLFCRRNTFQGSKSISESLSNVFFQDLLSHTWQEFSVPSTGKKMYKADGKEKLMLGTDYMFYQDKELLAISQDFAADDEMFLEEAARAWTKLANADRFAGPAGNICN